MGICQRIGSVVFWASVGVILVNPSARADGDLAHVQHIIIAMQENHSFDNYFGVWATSPTRPTTAAGDPGVATRATTRASTA